jgi:hypothetical protein
MEKVEEKTPISKEIREEMLSHTGFDQESI